MAKLPPKVHRSHGAYYYVHRNVWTRLCSESEGESEVYKQLAILREQKPPESLRDLFGRYLKAGMVAKSPATKREYQRQIEGPLMQAFGHMTAARLRPVDVALYLEARGGVTANREMSALSDVYQWSMRQGYVESNPCRGVRRNPERPRRRYMTNEELRAVMDKARPYEQDFIGMAYLTGMRQQDLIALRKANLTDAGIEWTEGKTRRPRTIGWSDALVFFIERALARSKCDYVLTNSRGEPWSKWGIQSMFRRLRAASQIEGVTLHDIRAKAASDAEDGRGLLAHASEAVFRRVYERRPKASKPVR